MLLHTRSRSAFTFFILSEGRRGRREITVLFRYETRTPKQHSTEAEREREGERAAQKREREREAKKYELLKNERTPLSLCLFPETFPGTRARRRERANEKKSRRRRERARRGGSANEDRAVFFRALRSVLCFVSLCWCQQRLFFLPKRGAGTKKN